MSQKDIQTSRDFKVLSPAHVGLKTQNGSHALSGVTKKWLSTRVIKLTISLPRNESQLQYVKLFWSQKRQYKD